ncbi:MAG: hypothetical protein A2015_03710 [Spirochaetes bacterium GWF1_31_7]|nr:MAG: hypothetical protein A2Y29_04940 [Spirochaetes bacterium GWE2_31_10]OHD53242.1 MAG: hypothetical protein A2015_03710 [Spirochaetes bacterium GWF1_31_7]OHD83120.1 MAG: hypothetical protein A2355_11535 [Spirochaetes bacterium RIFOXYB1_FULL_32_8]HBD94727.1 hypothetical protein [Spirochaetia bacterium]HBI39055.1 hypothetical protein [Spirochaetia bacterium]
MSRNLRKVNVIVFEDYVTLNSSADSNVLQILENDGYLESIGINGSGSVELPVNYIKELITNTKYVIPDDVKQNFINDIIGMHDDDNVSYSLF